MGSVGTLWHRDPRADGKPAYICGSDLGGCGKIRILAAGFEEDVLGRLFSRMDPEQLPGRPADDPTAEAIAELARLEGVKAELADLAGAGELDLSEFRAAKAANDRKMQALRETMARSAEDEALERTRAEAMDLRAKWDDLDIEARARCPSPGREGRGRRGHQGQELLDPDRVKVTPPLVPGPNFRVGRRIS